MANYIQAIFNSKRLKYIDLLYQKTCSLDSCPEIDIFICKNGASCGCYDHAYSVTYAQLWQDINDYIALENYTCNDSVVNCGEWLPSGQRDCCSSACYNIWNHILTYVGYDQNTINTNSPSDLDNECDGITISPSFFPTDENNPSSGLFGNISYSDRYYITSLNTDHSAGTPGSSGLPDSTEQMLPLVDFTLTHTTCATLQGGDTLTANIDTNALDLLRTGSYAPHETTSNYTNAEECRNCYGALYKLGTNDFLNRTENDTNFMSGVLINGNSGNVITVSNFSFSTTSQLSPTDCMVNKFPGSSLVNPYGILTNQLDSSLLFINTGGDGENSSYFDFDVKYKYEITWDDPQSPSATWYPFTNKWNVKYGPYGSSPSFSFEPDVNNYYQDNIAQPISASISDLDFSPRATGVGTDIIINWSTGVLVGNNDCSFSDALLSNSNYPAIGSIRPVSGPCVDNIKMDIWHPGPCGIGESLTEATSSGTPWSGYYYGDLIQNVYRKFWLNYLDNTDTISDDCPCCVPTKFILGVVKLEGCENWRLNSSYEIPLAQWEMNFTHCGNSLSWDNDITFRQCENTYQRSPCCNSTYYCEDGTVINDYRTLTSFSPCLFNSNVSYIPLQSGSFSLASGVQICKDMTPNVYPNYYPDYWSDCVAITKNDIPWVKTNIYCSPSPNP
jgi:hypothetical protein